MKKTKFYLLHLLGYFIIQFISVYIIKTLFNNIYNPLIFAGIFFVLSILTILIFKKWKIVRYIVSIILSSISSGGIIGFLLIQTNTYLSISLIDFIFIGLSYIVIIFIFFVMFCLLMKINIFKSHPIISLIIYGIILIVFVITFFFTIDAIYGVGLIIYFLSMIIYIISMLIKTTSLEEVYKIFTIASLSIIIVILIVALIILSEGDGDIDGIGDGDLDVSNLDDVIEFPLEILSNNTFDNSKKRGV